VRAGLLAQPLTDLEVGAPDHVTDPAGGGVDVVGGDDLGRGGIGDGHSHQCPTAPTITVNPVSP